MKIMQSETDVAPWLIGWVGWYWKSLNGGKDLKKYDVLVHSKITKHLKAIKGIFVWKQHSMSGDSRKMFTW